MSDSLFRPEMKRDEMEAVLRVRFTTLPLASNEIIAAVERSISTIRPKGQKVNTSNLSIFQCADEKRKQGTTIGEAIRYALNASPCPRRTQNDSEDEIDSLTRQYRRYRNRIDGGLDPQFSHQGSIFFEFVLMRQWSKAAAIFANANRELREKICAGLNKIGVEQ